MKRFGLVFAFCALPWGALGANESTSDVWPQWRGPALNGTSEATGLPDRWSETENVKWKVKLPSWSGATPIIWGDRIFVASGSEAGSGPDAPLAKPFGQIRLKREGKDLLLLCLSRKDGSLLWKYALPGVNYHIGKQNMVSPSPVTDGKMVWWLTGTGVVTALTVEGKPVWQADLQKSFGKFGLNWGYGSSPLLYEGLVIIPVMHGWDTKDPSYLVAFDAKSGRVVWRVERPTDAKREGPDAYTTPMIMRYPNRTEIIILGGDYVTGHDPKTGREIWRCGGLNPTGDEFYRAVASPLVVDDVVIACIKRRPLVAMKGGGKGLVTQTHTLWTHPQGFDVPSPVSDGTLVYILEDGGFMSCYELRAGQPRYERQRLAGGPYSASPLLAGGKIYVTNEKARTTVLAAGPEFKVLRENQLDDDYTLSSIAVSGGNLFIRTSSHLYCIGK